MSDSQNESGADYAHVDIHLCEGCNSELLPGDRVVCISDGTVTAEADYDVVNRRFWHLGCASEIEVAARE